MNLQLIFTNLLKRMYNSEQSIVSDDYLVYILVEYLAPIDLIESWYLGGVRKRKITTFIVINI